MKKIVFLMFVILTSVNCLAEGTLKWKLNLSFKADSVWIYEYDLINKFHVPFTAELSKSLKGSYSLQDPCVLVIQVKDINKNKLKFYYVPAMPGEEVVITDKDDGRYDFSGSAFYKRIHEIDLYMEEAPNKYSDILDAYKDYLKGHSIDEACVLMTPVALAGNKEKIKSVAQIFKDQQWKEGIKQFVDYMINQERITRRVLLSENDYKNISSFETLKIYGIALDWEKRTFIGHDKYAHYIILKEKPIESTMYGGYYYNVRNSDMGEKPIVRVVQHEQNKYDFDLEKNGGLYFWDFRKPLYLASPGYHECIYVFVERRKDVIDYLMLKEEKQRKQKEAKEIQEYREKNSDILFDLPD